MEVPETISQVPSGFGVFEGDYLVPDPGFSGVGPNHIWAVSASGGAPTEFASDNDLFPDDGLDHIGLRGGLFLPATFGSVGGRYVTAASTLGVDDAGAFHEHSRVVTLDGAGNIEDLVRFDFDGDFDDFPDNEQFPSEFTVPVMAPTAFGAFGGQLIFAHPSGAIAISEEGNVVPFFDAQALFESRRFGKAFGAVFAPTDFGAVGDTLLVSDSSPNIFGFAGVTNHEALILSVDSTGNATEFAAIPLTQQLIDARVGLRQMAFVPDSFGELSGLLLVSVSGSYFGGGSLGQVLGINEEGKIVKVLKLGTQIDKFDPRGFFFTVDGLVLISDASDSILSARVEDFVNYVVPEPTSFGLALFGLMFVLGRTRYGHGFGFLFDNTRNVP